MRHEYKAGYAAFHDGKDFSDKESDEWQAGWRAAENGEQLHTSEYLNDR